MQVPPRGLWRAGGLSKHTPAESWLGQSPVDSADLESIVLRYLAAFGPASVQDIQYWCGLTRLSRVVNDMRDRLVVYRSEAGRELYDLPGQLLADPDSPVPVRFLPVWDTVLLSYADKSRILPAGYQQLIFTTNGIIKATVPIDGYVAGIWWLVRDYDSAKLVVEIFSDLSSAATDEIAAEGMRLLKFLEPETVQHEVAVDQRNR